MQQEILQRMFRNTIMLSAPGKELSVTKKEDVLYAVKKAYEAMMPRTFRRRDQQNAHIPVEGKNQLFEWLSQKFSCLFRKGTDDFDGWHEKISDCFLDKMNRLLNESGYYECAYGKAQKIVNVTFKLLFLYDDADKYTGIFEKCHFILSKESLTWARENNIEVNQAWSNLTKEEYKQIQGKIKELLLENGENIPFYKEFYVWSEYRNR